MELRSPNFSEQATIPHRFTCDGDNVSPALEWSNVPHGAAELALICEDPDAPGKTFVHWLLWGIDPSSVTSIDLGDVPAGSHHGKMISATTLMEDRARHLGTGYNTIASHCLR
jgi:Raf kinase inhibitor-like YbhB/YbcL family protein